MVIICSYDFSGGTTNEKSYFYPRIQTVSGMNPEMSAIVLDVGYDSFEFHAKIWRTFDIHSPIQYREDVVIHNEETSEGINYWVMKKGERGR